jgi:hypothetical protein
LEFVLDGKELEPKEIEGSLNIYPSVENTSFPKNFLFVIVVDTESLEENLVFVRRDSTLTSS